MFLFLFFLIIFLNILWTVSVAYRISGTNTKLIAVSNSIEKIINLCSRLITTLQVVLLVALIEKKLFETSTDEFLYYFRALIFAATIGVIIGMFLIPSAHRAISKISIKYSVIKDELKLYLWVIKSVPKIFRKGGFAIPSINNLKGLLDFEGIPIKIFVVNIISESFTYIAVYACLYAGIMHPEVRMTSLSMVAVFQGLTALLSNLFVEVKLGLITDETANKKIPQAKFRKIIIFYLLSRLVATILAQFMLISSADLVYFLIKGNQ